MENKKELYHFLHKYENNNFHVEIQNKYINLFWNDGCIMFFEKESNINHLKKQFREDFVFLDDYSTLKNDITAFYNYIKVYLYRKDKIKNLLL